MNRHKRRPDKKIRRDKEYWPCDQKGTLLYHFTFYHNKLLEYFFCFFNC